MAPLTFSVLMFDSVERTGFSRHSAFGDPRPMQYRMYVLEKSIERAPRMYASINWRDKRLFATARLKTPISLPVVVLVTPSLLSLGTRNGDGSIVDTVDERRVTDAMTQCCKLRAATNKVGAPISRLCLGGSSSHACNVQFKNIETMFDYLPLWIFEQSRSTVFYTSLT